MFHNLPFSILCSNLFWSIVPNRGRAPLQRASWIVDLDCVTGFYAVWPDLRQETCAR